MEVGSQQTQTPPRWPDASSLRFRLTKTTGSPASAARRTSGTEDAVPQTTRPSGFSRAMRSATESAPRDARSSRMVPPASRKTSAENNSQRRRKASLRAMANPSWANVSPLTESIRTVFLAVVLNAFFLAGFIKESCAPRRLPLRATPRRLWRRHPGCWRPCSACRCGGRGRRGPCLGRTRRTRGRRMRGCSRASEPFR